MEALLLVGTLATLFLQVAIPVILFREVVLLQVETQVILLRGGAPPPGNVPPPGGAPTPGSAPSPGGNPAPGGIRDDSASGGNPAPVSNPVSGGNLENPTPGENPGGPSSSGTPPGGSPGESGSDQNCTASTSCSNQKTYSCNDLEITYGKCYTLTDTKGAILGRNFAGAYCPGCEYGPIYRVRESQASCSDEGKGDEVSSDGNWVLQDVVGRQDLSDTKYLAATPGPYVVYSTLYSSPASIFTGEASCYNWQCNICMRLPPPNGLGLLVFTDARFYLAPTMNPMNCLAFSYQETPCLKGPNTSGAKTEL